MGAAERGAGLVARTLARAGREVGELAPLQAYDAGGRARALGAILKALSEAKAADVSPEAIANAGALVNWEI